MTELARLGWDDAWAAARAAVDPEGALVLEAGCGTGAQTLRLAARSPRAVRSCAHSSAARRVEA